MKIAIPVANDKLCLHFGHCEYFAFVEVDENSKTIINKELLQPPAHEPGVLPAWIAEHGASLVIAGGMGMRAQTLFNQNGIQVIVGAEPEDPEALTLAYLNGTLKTGSNVCDH